MIELDEAAVRRQLVALGVPREKSERAARDAVGPGEAGIACRPSSASNRKKEGLAPASRPLVPPVGPVATPWFPHAEATDPASGITLRLNLRYKHRFALPWALLVSDNLHVGPNANRAKWRTYRDRRDGMHAWFLLHAQGAPLDGRCQLEVRFFVPNLRRRDCSNFLKALADALQGVAYHNDDQLVRYVLGREGVDRDRPRAEITVEEIAPS